MQGFGKITLKTCSVIVLVRYTKQALYIRLTKSKTAPLGVSLNDESEFLKDRSDLVEKLLSGETIIL